MRLILSQALSFLKDLYPPKRTIVRCKQSTLQFSRLFFFPPAWLERKLEYLVSFCFQLFIVILSYECKQLTIDCAHFFLNLWLQTIVSILIQQQSLKWHIGQAKYCIAQQGFIDCTPKLNLKDILGISSQLQPKISSNITSLRLQIFLSSPSFTFQKINSQPARWHTPIIPVT